MVKERIVNAGESACNLARFVQCVNHERDIMLMSMASFISGMLMGYVLGVYL